MRENVNYRLTDKLLTPPDNIKEIVKYIVACNIITFEKLRTYFNMEEDDVLRAVIFLGSHGYIENASGNKFRVLPEVKIKKCEWSKLDICKPKMYNIVYKIPSRKLQYK